MTIGTSLFLIAIGAILRYAVTVDAVAGIDLDTAGLILMLVGAVGFVIGPSCSRDPRRRARQAHRPSAEGQVAARGDLTAKRPS
jgi:hypothetical protein